MLGAELASSETTEALAGSAVRWLSERLERPVSLYLRREMGDVQLAARSGRCQDQRTLRKVALAAVLSGKFTTEPAGGDRETGQDEIQAVPFVAGDQVPAGAFVVPAALGAAERELVARTAELVGLTLAQHARLAATAQEALVDSLTGLGNKRAFHERLAEAVEDARPKPGTLSLVLVDLDNFKQLNDRQGHLVGDRILRDVGAAITTAVPAGGEGYRLGGDEFALLLACDKASATAIAEGLVGSLARPRAGEGTVSASAGVVGQGYDGFDIDELLHKADVALYSAKERGRNQVVAYSARLRDDPGWIEEQSRAREQHWWRRVMGTRPAACKPSVAEMWALPDVATLAALVAEQLDLSEGEVETAVLAATFLELGKLAIPDAIRDKPGRVTGAEARVIRERTGGVWDALAAIPHLTIAADAVRHCRERWDGGGWPDGLAGLAIPIASRILAVCDSYCALVRPRSHRPAYTKSRALLELQELTAVRFDPACVAALHRALGETSESFVPAPAEASAVPMGGQRRAARQSRAPEPVRDLVRLRLQDGRSLLAAIAAVPEPGLLVLAPTGGDARPELSLGEPVGVGWITPQGVKWHAGVRTMHEAFDLHKFAVRVQSGLVGHERRRDPRAVVRFAADLVQPGAPPACGTVLDVSSRALRIQTSLTPAVGEVLTVAISETPNPVRFTARTYRRQRDALVLTYDLFENGTREAFVRHAFRHAAGAAA